MALVSGGGSWIQSGSAMYRVATASLLSSKKYSCKWCSYCTCFSSLLQLNSYFSSIQQYTSICTAHSFSVVDIVHLLLGLAYQQTHTCGYAVYVSGIYVWLIWVLPAGSPSIPQQEGELECQQWLPLCWWLPLCQMIWIRLSVLQTVEVPEGQTIRKKETACNYFGN